VAANATTRNTLHAQIGNWGMHNRSVPTSEQALDVLRQAAARGAAYDLVIIDSALGGSDSMDLARSVKGNPEVASARLVMLMPVGRHGDARDARQAGITMCLSKPVRQSALFDCLVSVMAGTGEPNPDAAEKASAAAVRRRQGGRLLLAEDNPVNQEVALGILKIERYEVTVANNGAEALELYSRAKFDLVLMDCHMPHMDGFEATRKIREIEKHSNLKRVPIIALTANAMQQDREECLNAGMDDHLSKPYSRMQMRAMLERWLPEHDASEAPAAPPSAGVLEAPVPASLLDQAALDALRELETAGNPNLVSRLIDKYLSNAPVLLRQMVHGLEIEDASEIERAAHTLKSTSANLGARDLAVLCKTLQDSTHSGSTAEAPELIAQIEAAYRDVQDALRAEKSAGRTESVTA
ncbi:MAG: response regulator, partial [Burkholderiales bacterium]